MLCERDTSTWHQLLILGHEFWHVESGDVAVRLEDEGATCLVFPSLAPHTVARIVAARTHCAETPERDADLFGHLLLTMVSQWLPQQSWVVPPEAADVVTRLEASLGCRDGRDGRG
jgi:hypothetical protein